MTDSDIITAEIKSFLLADTDKRLEKIFLEVLFVRERLLEMERRNNK